MAATTSMLGKGLYDAGEVAWLLGHDSEWVVRWSTPSAAGPPVAAPSFDRRFAFIDLVGLKVGILVRQRGVSDRQLRQGVNLLRSWSGLDKPLSHHDVIESLATSGRSFLSNFHSGEYEDIGQGGQRVFQEIVRISLQKIQFNSDGSAERWVPSAGVVIDPAIQAGSPCIAGTRVPVATVVKMLAEDDAPDVAEELNISLHQVQLAKSFDGQLAAGVGLAA